MMQRIDELTAPPVVGKRYLVPTVRHPWFGRVAWWPVMGPRHEDAEHLNFPALHYHVDLRFLTEAQVRRFAGEGPYNIEWICAATPLNYRGLDLPSMPTWRAKTCRATDHGYPIALVRKKVSGNPFPAMHATYEGRRCGRDTTGQLVCPHKGFPLGSLAPDEHGRVVCPLHGLTIDVAAGLVVSPEGARA